MLEPVSLTLLAYHAGKLIRLRRKLTAAGDAVRGLFGVKNQDAAIQKLEALRVRACCFSRFCSGFNQGLAVGNTPCSAAFIVPLKAPTPGLWCTFEWHLLAARLGLQCSSFMRCMRGLWCLLWLSIALSCVHAAVLRRTHRNQLAPVRCGQDSVIMVRDLFREEGLTEFVIATIPTMLGINESSRLLRALRKEKIPCTRIVVNQVACSLLVAGVLDPWHPQLIAYLLACSCVVSHAETL